MKTQITFGTGQNKFGTLILFFICFLFSLNSHSQKILWTLSDVWKNGTWENSDKTLYTYDGNGHLIHDLTQNLNVSWKDLIQNDYTNNPDGTVQQSTSQLWNTTSNGWEKSVRTTYTYTAAKKVLTAESEFWYDPDWMPTSKQIYTYDGNNYLTKVLTQTYDFISPWKDISQITHINNLDGTVSQSVIEAWDVNAWKYRTRITYTYNNSKLVTELTEKWFSTGWENFTKETSDYDSSGFLTHTLSQNWIAGSWKNAEQFNITNYPNGAPYQIVSQFWNSSDLWENTYRTTFNINALGVDEHGFEKSFTFYPNPAQDKITIKTDDNNMGVKYVVTDQLGRQFSNGTITDQETIIDVDQFSNGIYFIQIGQNKNKVFKMIKK